MLGIRDCVSFSSCVMVVHYKLSPPPPPQSLHFTANVRGKEKRQLTIHNRTHSTWLLHPIISGEHWVGPDTLTIDPSRAGHYDLTYQPMTMTVDSHKHQVRGGHGRGRGSMVTVRYSTLWVGST